MLLTHMLFLARACKEPCHPPPAQSYYRGPTVISAGGTEDATPAHLRRTTSASRCVSRWHDFWRKRADAATPTAAPKINLPPQCERRHASCLTFEEFVYPMVNENRLNICTAAKFIYWLWGGGGWRAEGSVQELRCFRRVWIFHLPPLISSLLTLKCLSRLTLQRLDPRRDRQPDHFVHSCTRTHCKENVQGWSYLSRWGSKHELTCLTSPTGLPNAPSPCSSLRQRTISCFFFIPSVRACFYFIFLFYFLTPIDLFPSRWLYGDGGVVS